MAAAQEVLLFPFAQYYWAYGAFIAFVALMLFLDLGVFHRHAHEVKFKEALGWSAFWISLALLFNFGLYRFALWKFDADPELIAATGKTAAELSHQVALEFLTGFVVEKTLAVDNIFIFVVVFSYFRIPPIYQHRVLFFGVLGALFFRAIFIALGALLMRYEIVVVIFGGFLVFTGVKMMFSGEEHQVDPEKNLAIRLIRKLFRVHPELAGGKFFLRKGGLLYVTPLFIALLFMELTDIIFAVDSVPAIFAITREPFLVFTSNIFAILGLRSLYFLLSGVMDRFQYLKYGLALVLMFVGLKMAYLNHLFGGKFPVALSLLIIFLFIGGSMAVSWWKSRKSA